MAFQVLYALGLVMTICIAGRLPAIQNERCLCLMSDIEYLTYTRLYFVGVNITAIHFVVYRLAILLVTITY